MRTDWWRLGLHTARLAAEAQTVIALRMMKLAAGGPAAGAEAVKMTTEKVVAAGEAALAVVSGGSAAHVVRQYRRKVRANRRRLTRG